MPGLLVTETDGSSEQADSLKTAYDGASATGYDVFSYSVDEARRPSWCGRASGRPRGAAVECQVCPLVRSYGGPYGHRYSSKNDLDNPSVYDADLKVLILQVLAAQRPPSPSARAPRH